MQQKALGQPQVHRAQNDTTTCYKITPIPVSYCSRFCIASKKPYNSKVADKALHHGVRFPHIAITE